MLFISVSTIGLYDMNEAAHPAGTSICEFIISTSGGVSEFQKINDI